MKFTPRIIKKLMCYIIALCMLSCGALAHGGKTDGDGGHYNHSTGEYHWHHGWPAHQHSDTDGDGIYDYCPYRFEDKTGENSGSNSNHVNDTNDRNHVNESNEDNKEINNTIAKIAGIIFISIFAVPILVVAYQVIVIIITAIKNIGPNKKKREEEARKRAAERAKFEAERQAFIEKIGDKSLRDVAGVPPHIRFTNTGYPVDNNDRAFGTFTVYISKSGRCYHQKLGCCSARNAEHFFKAKRIYSPCSKCCKKQIIVPVWYDEYNKLKNEAKRFEIRFGE